MNTLRLVPKEEFDRVLELDLSAPVRVGLFADMCRLNVLYMICRAGSGHPGTCLSCLDIVSWIYLIELGDLEGLERQGIFFSSKGHDVPAQYAVLIALGRLDFEMIHRLRRLGGLPGHPDVSTPHIQTNTGSLGMGISKAQGFALARRLLRSDSQVYVLTGDGELQEGQFWESLQPSSNRGLGELTVVIDHNKIQSDTWVEDVSSLGDLEARLKSCGWEVARCDGHDLIALERVFARFAEVRDRPKALIADTVKGKGVSFMQRSPGDTDVRLYPYHAGGLGYEDFQRAADEIVDRINAVLDSHGVQGLALATQSIEPTGKQKDQDHLIQAYTRSLIKQAEDNQKIVALDADLALDTGLVPFEERFPERFFECGIAEQDMVSIAGGMALQGLLPVVHSLSCFLSSRPNEQIYNNSCEHTRIIYTGCLAGLVPGGPGHSHQCVRDISSLGGVPDLILVEPCCESEVESVVDFCFNQTESSCYIRLVSIPVSVPFELPSDHKVVLGKGTEISEGSDVTIISYGPVVLTEAYHALSALAGRSISAKLVNLPWLNRIDTDWLCETVRGMDWVFTIDNHYLSGGQGQLVASLLAQSNMRPLPSVHCFGVEDIPVCGTNEEVLRAHGMTADLIADRIAGIIGS